MELTPDTGLRYLRLAFEQMLAVAERLGDDLVVIRPLTAHTNAVASLVVHCCGVTEFWLGHVGCGRPSDRDRDAEFTASATVAELRGLVARALLQAETDLREIDLGTRSPYGDERRHLVDEDGSDAALVLHVVEELFQHLGHCEIAADALLAR